MSIIMPSLLPGIAHATAFARASQVLSRFTATDWYGYPDRLAERVLQTALHRAKPSIFISYKRSEAGALADQLFDALARDGFRVFVDRYSGTPGRYFPQELAEEMADKAVLLVIETPGLMQSKWTLWEIAFARRYRLGLIALQMDSATALTPIRTRIRVPGSGSLASSKLDQVMEFIRKEHVAASLRRTAFYRGLVRSAAAAGGGSLTEPPNGLFELRNGSGNLKAIISAVGKPGRLGDVHALMRHPAPGPPGPARLALGQHRHLPPAALDDLKWLADKTGIELHGHYEGYKRVNALC